jgi:hypothetical protein
VVAVAYTPTDDAAVYQASPSLNDGQNPQIFTDNTKKSVKRSYLKFDITGLPAEARITKVTLTLTAAGSSSATATIHAVTTSSWSESSISWRSAPSYTDLVISTGAPSPVAAGPVVFDLTSYIKGNGAWSVAINQAQVTQTVWSSKEGANPPTITVEYSLDDVAPPPPPPTTTDPVIAAAGDIACPAGYTVTATSCRHLQTSNLLDGVAAVLPVGDLQYDSTYSNFLASYDPTWGRFKSISHPVPGNHEGSAAAAYFQYWGDQAGETGKGWYSYDIASWHVVAINSNQCALSGCYAGSAQELWVRADLAAHPAACTLAYWHQPRWASGTTLTDNDYMSTIYADLYEAGVDVLVAGHNHAYERFLPMNPSGVVDDARGIQEFIVGTGGKDHSGSTTLRQNSVLRHNATFGVLKLTLHERSYEWNFQPEAGATFTDSGNRGCH